MEIVQSRRTSYKRRKILVLVFAVAFIWSCKKDAQTFSDPYYNYTPVGTGKYIIYDVDSIHFDDFTKTSDTFHFQLKELMSDPFVDLEGNDSYQLKRYVRDTSYADMDDKAGWTIKNVWYVTRTQKNYQRVEESFRYTNFIFPPIEGVTWKGNSYNTNPEWDFRCKNVHKKATINSYAFDSTVTVVQRNDSNAIDKTKYSEVYAANIGLVYRCYIDLHVDQKNTNNVPFDQKIGKGDIYVWRYVAHGNN